MVRRTSPALVNIKIILFMKFTDTNIDGTANQDTSKIPCENSNGDRGHLTPKQLLDQVHRLNPDWITLADMTGQTIPSNTLAQKSGVLHFGDTPLYPQVSRRVYASSSNYDELEIVSIPIDGSLIQPETMLWLDLELSIGSIHGNPSGGDFLMLLMDFDRESYSYDTTSGVVIVMNPGARTILRMNGPIAFSSAVDGKVHLVSGVFVAAGLFEAMEQSTAGAPGFDVVKHSIRDGVNIIYESGTKNIDVGVDNAFHLRLKLEGSGSTGSQSVVGRCSISPYDT